MFVILLNYRKPLTEVDRLLGEHRQFLQRYYASGHFLMSGRQEPRTGGVILAQAHSQTEITTIVQEDPLHREGVAEYKIIEFCPSMSAPQWTEPKTA